jgi:hypothetical protein
MIRMTKEWDCKSVYHLHLKAENKDEYYGSMAAMYKYHNKKELGITIASLTNFYNKCKKESIDYVYTNALCSIRKAPLITNTLPL